MKRKALYPTLDVQRVNSSDIRRFCKSLKPQGSLSVEHPQQKQQDQQHHQPAKQADEPGQQQLPDTTQDNIEVTQLSEQQQEQGPPYHQQQQQAPPSTSLHPTAAEAAAAAMDQQGGSPTQDAIELTPVGTDVVDQAARSRCVDRAVGSFVLYQPGASMQPREPNCWQLGAIVTSGTGPSTKCCVHCQSTAVLG